MMRNVSDNAEFPYKSKGLVYYRVEGTNILEIRDIGTFLKENPRAKKVYATWHGQWKTDMFLVDDMPRLRKEFK